MGNAVVAQAIDNSDKSNLLSDTFLYFLLQATIHSWIKRGK